MNLLIYVSLHYMQAIPDFDLSDLAKKATRERTNTPKSVSELYAVRVIIFSIFVNLEY